MIIWLASRLEGKSLQRKVGLCQAACTHRSDLDDRQSPGRKGSETTKQVGTVFDNLVDQVDARSRRSTLYELGLRQSPQEEGRSSFYEARAMREMRAELD